MKKFFSFLILFFLIDARAEIIETKYLQEIYKKFLRLSQDYEPSQILGIFEIKNTLLTPINSELNPQNENLQGIFKKALTQLKPSSSVYLDDIIFTNYKHGLINKNLPKFINQIRAKGIPLIAINANLTGNLNEINRLEVWKYSYLKSFNLDFSYSFPKNSDISFTNLQPFQGTYPHFYKGILSTNTNYSRAQILINFLYQIKFTPKIIIAIASDINILRGIEEQLTAYNKNIKFMGYLYRAKDDIEFNEVDGQNFIDFWYKLIDKVNKVKRKMPINQSKNPYDE